MKELKKPAKLQPGDRIAAVSLSWGGAGDAEILWRYHQGKERLQTIFGLEVVEMPHTQDMPVLYNMNFGHTEPKFCIPYGALAQIDCENGTFSIMEAAVY